MVQLVPMSPEECRAFLERSDRQYAQDHVRAGTWEESEALRRAHAETEQLLPKGLETPDQFLRVIRDAAKGDRLGEVWYCIQRSEGRPQLFVYWIGIDEKHRRHGYATEVLNQLETEARRAGANRVVLHVFGDNASALSLYAKLGYKATNVMMAKPVTS
jgi:ribosomal protein S18 acetylase RimI-like enzyme